MPGFLYKSYNFINKDPIIDYIRTIIRDSKMSIKEISERSSVSQVTINNWLYGKTLKPQAATINAVIRSCGYKLDITSINTPMMIIPTAFEPKAKEISMKTVIHIRKYRDAKKMKRKAK